jgi:hypothetical protein
MSTSEIQKIIKNITFDAIEDPEYDLFTEQQVVEALIYENAVANAKDILPEDYKWYMANRGETTAREVEYQVQIDSDTSLVYAFDRLVSPESACQQYRYQTCTGSYMYRLKDISENDFILDVKFLPISSESQGEMLVMDIKDDIGSIYQFPSEEVCKTHDLAYQPSLVAKSLSEFLKELKPLYTFRQLLKEKNYKEIVEYSGIWKKNAVTDKELFYNCIEEYEKQIAPDFIKFKDVNEFLNVLVNNLEKITINEPRAVELFYLSFGGNWKAKNTTELEVNIQKIQNLKSDLDKKRENYTIETLEKHTSTGYSSIGTDHNFYKTILESTIHGLVCKETFVFYKHPDTQMLSFVKRVKIEIEDMKIKGIDTFEYDFTWSSKTAKKTKWSEIPATIYLNRYKEDFTENYFEFIRQTINDASIKEKLEQFIFDRYQKHDYPGFLDMNKADKSYFEDSYPKVSSPNKIWKLLGEEFDIHFVDEKTYDLQFEYLPDDEHGLKITVTNEQMTMN